MRVVLATAALALAAVALPGWAQDASAADPAGSDPQAADPVFQVDYTNPSLSPSHWTLTLHPDGRGHFRSEVGTARTRGIEAPGVDRDIRVSAAFAGHVFDVVRQHHWFSVPCNAHTHEKVAFQGVKRFSYSGPEGKGTCEFNYSKDQKIDALSESLVAVASTIVEGARLESLLVHDRLGMDEEMEYLVEAARDGRVQQMETIREILERVAQDDRVMDRVRQRARELLALSQT
jgi:hypothetical protein